MYPMNKHRDKLERNRYKETMAYAIISLSQHIETHNNIKITYALITKTIAQTYFKYTVNFVSSAPSILGHQLFCLNYCMEEQCPMSP